jgi:hypothetical protein
MSDEPTVPTVPVDEVSAASYPARKFASYSLNSTQYTLGAGSVGHSSTIRKRMRGLSSAASGTMSANSKPVTTTIVAPSRIAARMFSARVSGSVLS